MSNKKQTVLNLIVGIFTLIVQIAINFFLSPYIVKTLGEEANGFTQLANNFVSYASLITIAFNSMAGRFISVKYHTKKLDEAKSYYSSSIICNIFIGAFLLFVAAFTVWKLDSLIVIDNASVLDVKLLFCFVFLTFFVNLAISVYSCAAFVTNKIYITNLLNLIRIVLNAFFLFVMFSFLAPKMYFVSLVTLVISIILLPTFFIIQRKLLPKLVFSRKAFSKKAVFEMIKSGIWNTINQCGHILMTGLDLVICNLFISPAAMGVLSVSKIVPTAITSLATTINTSFTPSLVIDWVNCDSKTILKSLRTSMNISCIIVSIPIITFCVFSVSFYQLWMPLLDAHELSVLSLLACMAFIPWAGPQTLYNVFTAANKLKVNSLCFVGSGILNLILVYFILKFTNLGIYAVAGVSSSITIIRNLVITAPYTAKLLNLKWYAFYRDVLTSLLCCLINLVIGEFVIHIMLLNGWLGLIFEIALTVFFTLIIDLFVVLKKNERIAFFKKLKIIK